MADTEQGFHSAPAPRDVSADMQRLRRLLDELGAAQGQSGLPSQPAQADPTTSDAMTDACSLLRLRLAVRGWVAPLQLLNDVEAELRDTALQVVGAEVELSERMRPGQWFLALAARKQAIAATEPTRLRDAAAQRLAPTDADDPLRLALLAALALAPGHHAPGASQLQQALAPHTSEVLQELERMPAWGATLPGLEAIAATAAAELRRRIRDRQREAMGATVVFGREREQQALRRFLQAGPTGGGVRIMYLSGIGGSGKSTLLLAAEHAVRSDGAQIVVRLDFDSPSMNPRNPEQMDIQLLNALAVELPAAAGELHRIATRLQSLMDHRTLARIKATGAVHAFTSSESVTRGRVQAQRAMHASDSGSDAESAANSQHYGRISAMAALDTIPALTARPLVLLLDTLESVTRIGPDGIDSVLAWLSTIGAVLPRPDKHALRVVLAGRDPLGSLNTQALAQRFGHHDIVQDPDDEIALSDLDIGPACELLVRFGMPPDAAVLAARALPRNPLVLRLAARTWQTNPDQLAQLQHAYQAGHIDRHTAASYLAQRVVQHVPHQLARRYVVAALSLPAVTERRLQDIVIPAVDSQHGRGDRALAGKVYRALVRASWLTIEDAPGTFHWHAELRALALPMIEADPAHRLVAARIQDEQRRQDVSQQARAPEHPAYPYPEPIDDAAPGHAPHGPPMRTARPPITQPDGFDPETLAPDAGNGETTSAQWHRMRLEGVGGLPGDGERLVAQGHVERALQLYRERPTRAPGVPPTFVIRALALSGAGYRFDVDPERVLDEVHTHMKKRSNRIESRKYERLYWLTRMMMLDEVRLPRNHIEVLHDLCHATGFNRQRGALYGLIGILEALRVAPDMRHIAPAAWPPPKADVGPESRFSMLRTRLGRFWQQERGDHWIVTRLGALLRFDERWPELLLDYSGQEIIHIDGGASRINELLRKMRHLQGARLIVAEDFLASWRDVRIRINLVRIKPSAVPALMRGNCVEFHAPLAALLSDRMLWRGDCSTEEILQRLLQVVDDLHLPHALILPLSEFTSEKRRKRHASNLQAAIGAVITALDRAAVLDTLTRALMRQRHTLFASDGQETLGRLCVLCRSYQRWNDALRNETAMPAITQGISHS